MKVAINGSYEPYAYLALLQVSLIYLQRFGLSELISTPQGPGVPTAGWLDVYRLLTRVVGSTLSWMSWMLAVYVGFQFNVASGILFFVVGFGCNIILMLTIPSFPRVDTIAHLISIPATVYFLRATLLSIGIETPL